MSRGKAYIGTSGYSYEHWADDIFYPKGLPKDFAFAVKGCR